MARIYSSNFTSPFKVVLNGETIKNVQSIYWEAEDDNFARFRIVQIGEKGEKITIERNWYQNDQLLVDRRELFSYGTSKNSADDDLGQEQQGSSNNTIKEIILWQNNAVMVFDALGNQMPEYQGMYSDVVEKLRTVDVSQSNFKMGKWLDWIEPIEKDNFFDRRWVAERLAPNPIHRRE